MEETTPKPDEPNLEPMSQDEEVTSVTSTSSETENSPVSTTNHKNTNNGYHPQHPNKSTTTQQKNSTEFLNKFNNHNNKYDLTETTESTATSLFLNISTKCVPTELTNGSPVIDTQHTITQNETITSTSPTATLSSEPANKRARLSNS